MRNLVFSVFYRRFVYFFCTKDTCPFFVHVSSPKSLQSSIKCLQGSVLIIVESIPVYYYSSLADK